MRSLILPLLVPFVSAMVTALLVDYPRLVRALSILAFAGLTAWVFWLTAYVDAHGIQTMAVGGYAPPWGIVFVADRLACIMLCLSMTVGTVVLLYTFGTSTATQQRYFFYPLFHVTLLGVNWSFITGDLFNLFVAYEVMLIGSYGMLMVGASPQQIRQGLQYVALNVVGSTLFVAGLGLLYALAGTLNMAELALRTQEMTGARAGLATTVSLVLLVVFALKAGAFPLFFWLPDAYPVVPAGVNGYFAGLLTKVGVYSLLRVVVMMFRQEGHELATQTLLVLSAFTMLLGVLGAMCQWDIRRILSWHSISQVGYMVMGIGLASAPDPRIAQIAIVGTVLYIVHHGVVKSSLFLAGGIAERVSGSQELEKMGGVLNVAPGVAGLFLVAALSLAGMPPFSGFVSKFVLVRAGLAGGNYLVVAVAIVTSFLTLYSMGKIWQYAFWRREPNESAATSYRALVAPTAVLVALTIALGLAAQPFLSLAARAADDLTDPVRYIAAVDPEAGRAGHDLRAEAPAEHAP